jgi:UDP-N-acetylmuramyl pentapeptide phosphotransferase/UDP-N-acetylglucosamine-1-phosphate transferase
VAFTLAVVFWIVSYVNAFNFMDGINGLAAGQATVAGLAWFIVGQARDLPALATAGLALAGAAIGFGIYNYPRGTVFLGDVGSYFLGAVVGSVAVFGLRSGLPPETVLAPLALFAADTGFTLARRIASGERWHEAHCDHAYQRLTRRFQGSHARTTALVVMLMAIVAALGDLSLAGSTPLRIAGDAGIVVVLATYVSAAALSVRTRGREPAFA